MNFRKEIKSIIAEAFDNPYPLKWKEEKDKFGDVNEIAAIARIESGAWLRITFTYDVGLMAWDIVFDVNQSAKKTGNGDSFRIFATVKTAVEKFLRDVKPSSFKFSAEKDDENDSTSRMKLYDLFAKQLANKTGKSLDIETRSDVKWYEFKPKKPRRA